MSQPPEDFSEIRRVLAWKRHETPPPGYFNNFSTKVIARIEAGRFTPAEPWWQALLRPLNWQRGLLGANVLIAAGVGIVGVATYHTLRSAPEEDGVASTLLPVPIQGVAPGGAALADGPAFRNSGAADGAVSLAGFSGFGSFDGTTNDHTAPAGLFSPPGMGQLQPHFVFPAH